MVRRQRTEQAHICLGVRAYSYLHPDRYAIDLLNTVLGEGMSSRLFLNIRERLGIAYDVHSFMQKHRDTGYVAVYLGVDPKKAVGAVEAVMGELDRLCDEEVAPYELERAKEFTKGRLRLELETTNGVAFWLTYQELLLGEIRTIEEELALVDAVTAADVRRVACDVLSGPIQMAVIGPFTNDAAFRSAIQP
jgi:predicted Zn-dependent peptidase